jgi:chromosome segregation ATPase
MENPFEVSRGVNPQGVIDCLLGQTTRQAKAIHEANEQIGALKNQLQHAEMDKRKLAAEVDRLKNELREAQRLLDLEREGQIV